MLCNDCGEDKPTSEFYPRRNTKKGVHPYCKPCFNERSRLYKRDHARSERELNRMRQRSQGLQTASQMTASRKGQPWTTVEIDLMRRTDLSVSEIARRLGRTYKSILQMRQRDKTMADRGSL